MPDDVNTISRIEMERAIANGGSVLYKGQSITTVDALPSELQIARDNADEAGEKVALAKLAQQKAAIEKELEASEKRERSNRHSAICQK